MRINLRYNLPAPPAEVITAAAEWLQTDSPDIPLQRSANVDGAELLVATTTADVTELITRFEATPTSAGTDLRVRIEMRGIGMRGKLHQLAMLPSRGLVKDHSRRQLDAFAQRLAAPESAEP